MSGTGSKERPQDAVRSRRIGWRAAGRLLDGQDGGRGTEDLRTLITLASVPMYAITARAEPTERDAALQDVVVIRSALHDTTVSGTPPLPYALLAAFRESAALTPTTTTTTAKTTAVRRQPTPRAVVLRFGAAVLVVCGAGTAAASVGVLPAGMQRIAHEYLGVGSAPAPSTQVPSSSTVTSRRSAGRDNEAAPTTGAASASTVTSLCRQISQAGDNWSTDLSAADQAVLVAAAGNGHKVEAYCKQLFSGVSASTVAKGKPGSTASASASPSPSTRAMPLPEPTGKPSATPNAKATVTHSDARASHAPAPPNSGTH